MNKTIFHPILLNPLLLFLLQFTVFFATGCRDKNNVGIILSQADTMLNRHPDSALILIRSIHCSDIRQSDTRARYSLLHSQILDKNYIDLTNDSIIKEAVKYYKRKGSNLQKAKTYFYLGRIYRNANETEQAIKMLTEAEHCAITTSDFYLCGLIYNTLGNMYYSQGSFGEAIEMYERSGEYFGKNGDLKRKANALSNIGKTYYLKLDDSSSIQYYQNARKLYIQIQDTVDILRMNGAIADKLVNLNHIARAEIILRDGYEKYNASQVLMRDYPLWVKIYIHHKNYAKAKEYALHAINQRFATNRIKAGLYLLLRNIECKRQNYQAAYMYGNSYNKCLIAAFTEDKEQLIQEIKEKYNKEKLEASYLLLQQKQISGTIIFILIITLLIGAGAFGLWLQIIRHKALQAKFNRELSESRSYIESVMENLSSLEYKYKILQKEGQENEQSARFLKMFEQRLVLMKDVMETAYISESNPAHFYHKFKEYINANSKTEDAFGDLQYLVNEKYFGIIDYLKINYPTLTKSDLDFFSMFCFGFSSNAIRLIYGHTNIDSVFTKRKKLREKLLLPPGIQMETFIKNLKKELQKNSNF
ncbi:MAG: tetratricopeptide repeat protein [Bacteroidales bacterium]